MRVYLRSAYMTVEATIAVPIVLFSYVLLMYMLIYVYDKALLIQDTSAMSVYASEEYFKNEQEFEKNLTEKFNNMKEEHPYLSAGELDMSVSKKKSEVTIKSTITFYNPIGDIAGEWFHVSFREIRCEKKMTLLDPVNQMLITEDILR